MTDLELAISELMNLWHEGYIQPSGKQGATALVADAFDRLDDARRKTGWYPKPSMVKEAVH